MSFDGRIMSQQASGGGVAAKFGRAKSHEFRCQVIFSKASFHFLEGFEKKKEMLNRDSYFHHFRKSESVLQKSL